MAHQSIVTVTFAVFCFFSVSAFGQLPNQHGQIWQEYDLRQVVMPPPNVKTFDKDNAPVELPMKAPTIIDIVKRETGESAWSGQSFGLIGTDGQRLFVYHTPAVQQKVAETIGRFQRPETKGVRFVMESHLLSFSEGFNERLAVNSRVLGLAAPQRFEELPEMPVVTQISPPTEYRTPVLQYLRPILGPDGQPNNKQDDIEVYWVAKDDIPKVRETWNDLTCQWNNPKGIFLLFDNVCLNEFQGPQIVTINGQLGATLEIPSDLAFPDDKSVTATTVFAKQSRLASFSLLSWDGRTISSDVHAEFSLRTFSHEPAPKRRTELQNLGRTIISEKGLVYPADGMLVVFFCGTERMNEFREEKSAPVLGKIPFLGRQFESVAIGRETQSVHGILTIRMLAPNEEPRAAVAPAVIRRLSGVGRQIYENAFRVRYSPIARLGQLGKIGKHFNSLPLFLSWVPVKNVPKAAEEIG